MLAKIKLGEMNHCRIAANGIEPAGLEKIAELLTSAGISADVMNCVEPVWSTKRGTYPKRLARALKSAGYLASPALLGAIGQAAADNCSRSDEYWFRIDREFTCDESGFRYEKGEHGDDCSCFHPGGMYDTAPYDIENAGGMLLRTFEPSNPETGYHFDQLPGEPGRYYAGVGRCFIVPCTYHDSEDDYHEGFVMINGYCRHGYSHDLLHLARLVATTEGLSYRKVMVHDHFRRIYINNGCGYLVGEWESISDVRSVDIYVKDSGRTPSLELHYCNSCGGRYREEDLTVIGDDLVCPDCLQFDYTVCRRCGEWALKWDAPIVSGEHWCRDCANEYAVECGYCGDQYPEVETYKVGQENWCETCFDMHAEKCSECGRYYASGEVYKTTDRAICWGCAHNRCCACGKKVNRPLKVDGQPYCRRCAPV